MWLYFVYLDPVFQVLYHACDWLFLWWTSHLPPVWAIACIGVLTGLGMNLVMKFFSDQRLLGKCKDDMKKLKGFVAEAKKAGDKDTVTRLTNVSRRIGNKYAINALKPSLWTVPPVLVVALWAGSRLGFEPIRPGQEVEVVANFEDGASGFAHIIPNEGIAPVGPSIVPVEIPPPAAAAPAAPTSPDDKTKAEPKPEPGNPAPAQPVADKPAGAAEQAASAAVIGVEAHWKIRAAKEGKFPLVIRDHVGKTHTIDLEFRKAGGRPPEAQYCIRWDSPTADQLQFIIFKLKDRMPAAWWNLKIQWMGVYLIVALFFGINLRFVLGVK
jgi:uncharacterized membrane protein (DUF106 family)